MFRWPVDPVWKLRSQKQGPCGQRQFVRTLDDCREAAKFLELGEVKMQTAKDVPFGCLLYLDNKQVHFNTCGFTKKPRGTPEHSYESICSTGALPFVRLVCPHHRHHTMHAQEQIRLRWTYTATCASVSTASRPWAPPAPTTGTTNAPRAR